MGCFISTSSVAPPQSKTLHIPTSAASPQHNAGSKSPPPVVYEETVKGVLSQTPAIAKRPMPPVSTFHESQRMLHQNGGDARKPADSFSNDDPSDVDLEIHGTFSESFSTGNDGPLRWRPMLSGRSFPGELQREKTAGRSPARRSGASPGRVKPGCGYSSIVGGRESPRPSGSGSSKKGLAAGKSTRKAGNYPGRVGCGSGERIRTGEEEEEREPPTNNELLESSLVSLLSVLFFSSKSEVSESKFGVDQGHLWYGINGEPTFLHADFDGNISQKPVRVVSIHEGESRRILNERHFSL